MAELHYFVQAMEWLSLEPTKVDSCIWKNRINRPFSVASFLSILVHRKSRRQRPNKLIWKSMAPAKLCAFFWQAWWEEIKTLARVAEEKSSCAFSPQYARLFIGCLEKVSHLLLHFKAASFLWIRCLQLATISWVIPTNINKYPIDE